MTAPAAEMKRTLGLVSATTLIVGSAIGSGIFLLPSTIAQRVGSPGLMIAVWVVCGLLSLAGALTFAEMGAMYPRAGGQYVFLKEAFGEKVAFLYGWANFGVVYTGVIAAVATAFAIYVGFFFPLSTFGIKLVAVACILGLTAINYVGVKYGGVISNVFTIAKVAALAGLILAAFLFGESGGTLLTPFLPAQTAGLVGAFGLAMVAALFAYDGWNQAAFVAGEVKDPRRTLPLSMIIGVLIVMAVYVGANLAYLHILPIDRIAGSNALAAEVMGAIVGPIGAKVVAAAIIVSTFGTVNAYVLAGPRVSYALAQDGLFYDGFAALQPRFGVPGFGLIMQAEIACLLVLTGTYSQLVTYMVFAVWLFYGITGVGFFLLRRNAPHIERPYKALGYPVVPGLFIAASLFIVINTLVTDTRDALLAIGILALGFPLLALGLRNRRKQQLAPAGSETVPLTVSRET